MFYTSLAFSKASSKYVFEDLKLVSGYEVVKVSA